jgi:hypothetical protein
MGEIEAFCWFVASERDEFMKLEDIKMLCNKVPKAEMVVLPDLKHGELTPVWLSSLEEIVMCFRTCWNGGINP